MARRFPCNGATHLRGLSQRSKTTAAVPQTATRIAPPTMTRHQAFPMHEEGTEEHL